MYDHRGLPADDFAAIVKILAAVYLRYRERLRRQNSLDVAATTSVHGHEVNGTEKGNLIGNRGTATA